LRRAGRPAYPQSAGQLGLRLRINGVQSVVVYPLPEDNFNLGVDAPAAIAGRPTRIEVTLVGVGLTNFLAWVGRIVETWPLHVPCVGFFAATGNSGSTGGYVSRRSLRTTR